MITKEQVEHIAKLARLGLTAKEIEKTSKELSTILDYVEKLKEVDIVGVAPTSHSLEVENVMREDEESQLSGESASHPAKSKGNPTGSPLRVQQSPKLLDLAPEIKNGYLKVKSIL